MLINNWHWTCWNIKHSWDKLCVKEINLPLFQSFSCLSLYIFCCDLFRTISLWMKYSSSSPLPTPLISVLYFSWLKDRKTYWADNAALPLSPYKLTSNGKETVWCSPKSVFVFFKEAFQQGVCNWCPSHLWVQGPGTCSCLLPSQYFSAVSVQFWRWSIIKAEGGTCTPSAAYLSDLIAYACITECSVTSSGRRNTVHVNYNIYKNFVNTLLRQKVLPYLSCE